MKLRAAIPVVLCLALGPGRARADQTSPAAAPTVRDRWTTLAPGIRHLHRTTAAPLSVHVLVVDLRAPGVVVEVTPHAQRWRTPSQYGRASGAVASINGGFWSVFDQQPEGLVMHGGTRWPRAADDEFYGFFAIDKHGRALISTPRKVVRKVDHLREAISGRQLILAAGRVTQEARCPDGCRYRQPRTAVGVSRDGHTVYLAVVDGRQRHSRGLGLVGLARLLAGLGAHRAINLDGGGSAALYLATKKGLVSRPADRRERDVLNHIGVFWRPTRAQLARLTARRAAAAKRRVATRQGRPEDDQAVLKEPPRPSSAGVPTGIGRLWQRHWREVLAPRNLLFATPLLAGLILLGVWGVRRRRG
jgi:hypothetical protein